MLKINLISIKQIKQMLYKIKNNYKLKMSNLQNKIFYKKTLKKHEYEIKWEKQDSNLRRN